MTEWMCGGGGYSQYGGMVVDGEVCSSSTTRNKRCAVRCTIGARIDPGCPHLSQPVPGCAYFKLRRFHIAHHQAKHMSSKLHAMCAIGGTKLEILWDAQGESCWNGGNGGNTTKLEWDCCFAVIAALPGVSSPDRLF